MTREDWIETIKQESVKPDEEPGLFCTCEFGKVLDLCNHAIGHKRHNNGGRLYHRHGKLYYKAYRNHYDAGGEDIPIWDALVELGYAYKRRLYHLTEKGIAWLGHQQGIIIKEG